MVVCGQPVTVQPPTYAPAPVIYQRAPVVQPVQYQPVRAQPMSYQPAFAPAFSGFSGNSSRGCSGGG